MQPPNHTIHRILFIDDEDDFNLFREAVRDVDPSINISLLKDGTQDPANFPWLEPDLIFLDLNMPGCNGYDYLKRLKASDLKDVPVVIFTTSRNQLHIDKAYQYGATLFLSKPFSYTALVQSIRGLLALDWSHPSVITSAYYSNGKYKAYTPG
jgi:DNA-binding NarL/FixJ family response regulator